MLRWLTGGEVEEVYATGSVRKFDVFAKYDDLCVVQAAEAPQACTRRAVANPSPFLLLPRVRLR